MFASEDRFRIEAEFDCFCKRVLHNEAVDYYRHKAAKEGLDFSVDMSKVGAMLVTYDMYPSDCFCFELPNGLVACVKNDALGEAIGALPKLYREIILLSYMHDLSDQRISGLFGLSRRTVQRLRTMALDQLRDQLWRK